MKIHFMWWILPTPSYNSYSYYVNTQTLPLPDGLDLTLPSGFDVIDTSDSSGIANIETIAVNNLLQSDHWPVGPLVNKVGCSLLAGMFWAWENPELIE